MSDLVSNSHPVVLFDGLCNLCSGAVQFIIRRDKQNFFRFASLQSAYGQQVLENFQLPATDFNSFVLLENGRIYTKSTAALRISKKLSGLWPVLYGFMVVPPFIRNGVYSLIARNRYKWFGRRNSCWLPTPALQAKFMV